MGTRRQKPGILERSAGADLFRHTLSQIPTVYGRLNYLASLRDPNSGAYRHHGLTAVFGAEQSVRALQASHTKTFREWLRLPLSAKSADLIEYLEAQPEPRSFVAAHWLRTGGYLGCVPDSASRADREFFISDLEALLDALSHAAVAGPPGPKS